MRSPKIRIFTNWKIVVLCLNTLLFCLVLSELRKVTRENCIRNLQIIASNFIDHELCKFPGSWNQKLCWLEFVSFFLDKTFNNWLIACAPKAGWNKYRSQVAVEWSRIYVTGESWTGTLACLSPFPVWYWIGSDLCLLFKRFVVVVVVIMNRCTGVGTLVC